MPTPEEILQSGNLHGQLVRASYIDYEAGENIRIDGNIISAIDNDTIYSAGPGINITDTTISANPDIANNLDIDSLFR